MSELKLETALEKAEIKQTRDKVEPIRFKDDAINKVKKENYNFGKKRFKYIPFKVSKDTHQKGLVLKILKGSPGEKEVTSKPIIQMKHLKNIMKLRC